ncbi:hypothetical protein NDY24_21160 [Xanthomonas hortorum pv. pelargonii]|nr:hypothetical protein NDY24_21160 [Xanthomonas hortorum pv. pelargonii]
MQLGHAGVQRMQAWQIELGGGLQGDVPAGLGAPEPTQDACAVGPDTGVGSLSRQ